MKCVCGNEMDVWKSELNEDGELVVYYRCPACKTEVSELVNKPKYKAEKDED